MHLTKLIEKTMKKYLYIFIISLSLIGATSCTEKNDFIPEPTPTSVIVSGVVTTTAGKPLANIPIYIDYNISYWLGPQHTLHKATTTTDNNGRYRLFFEPERMNGPESDASEAYYLYADLGKLSSDEFIMPSELNYNETNVYKYGIYKELGQGENYEINLHFPKKKEITIECRNFLADKSLNVINRIRFGVNAESLSSIFDLDASGNGRAIISCAVDEINNLTIQTTDNIPEEFESKEIRIDNNSDASIIFDNKDIIENCRFKLSLYDYFSFDGESYEKKEALSIPAPFDYLGFRIVKPDGNYEAFDSGRYQYYDSIVWSSSDFPETFRVYERKRDGSAMSEHLISQWGSYFFDKGIYKAHLKGYKKGRIIHSDSISFELKNRDFLCFDWAECKTAPKQESLQGIYCQLNSYYEYKMSTPVEIDGTKIVRIYVKFRDHWSEDILLNWQETRLNHFLWTHLGQRIDYDRSEIRNIFRHLPINDLPGAMYENDKTRAIIMHSIPDETNEYEEECFYIHVESKTPSI